MLQYHILCSFSIAVGLFPALFSPHDSQCNIAAWFSWRISNERPRCSSWSRRGGRKGGTMRQTWLWLNSSRRHGDAKKVHLLFSGVRRRWRRPNPCLSLPPSFSPFFSFFFTHPLSSFSKPYSWICHYNCSRRVIVFCCMELSATATCWSVDAWCQWGCKMVGKKTVHDGSPSLVQTGSAQESWRSSV